MKHDLMAKAKATLILDQPFFASILLSMPITEDNSQPTMATDGESIVYNKSWMESLSLPEVVFVLAHEVLHCVHQHMTRRGSRNHNRWNIAADYVINDCLVQERVGTMPKGGLLDAKIVKRGNGTTEGVYDILPKSSEDKSAGQKGGALDSVRDAGTDNKQGASTPDVATLKQKESEIRVRVIQAKNAAKMQGKMSAGLERLINDLVKVRTDWRSVLRRFISERAKTDYSFARPKRRFLAEDIYLPSLTGEKLGAIVVAVDCSGSISDKILNEFSAELNAICEDTRPSEIKVLYFDSEILRTEEYNAENLPIKLNPIGGGGTAFSPIFEEINKYDTQPIACIVLTDLQCGDFGEEPNYPVLWASNDREEGAPFGEIVLIKENE